MNVAIIYGGKSSEHDVSVITACIARGFFDGKLYMVYFDKQNRCFLAPSDLSVKRHASYKFKKQASFLFGQGAIGVSGLGVTKKIPIDVAVNCCHGVCGEDGSVAALCNYADIPLVGSDVVPSAVAMDKIATKHVLSGLGFPVLQGFGVDSSASSIPECDFPVVVKPSLLGSSIGVTVARDETELKRALELAFTYCDRALVERALTNFNEYNCAAFRFGNEIITSVVAQPVAPREILTFDDKYVRGSKVRLPSADGQAATAVKQLTEQIYRQMGFSGVIRVDYLADNDSGELFVNEINSIPGSLGFNLFGQTMSPSEFGGKLVEQAIAERRNRRKLVTDYVSDLLDIGSSKK